jgi:hypothetical protein
MPVSFVSDQQKQAYGAYLGDPSPEQLAPTKPNGVDDGNWIQTVPGKGWNTLLRLYSPLEPFFTKQWRPSEIEVMQ